MLTKRLTTIGFSVFAAMLTWPHNAHGQIQVPWISSVTYQQTKTGSSTNMDIHVTLLAPGAPGYPCTAGSTLTVDPLPLTNQDVQYSQDAPNVNPLHLKPAASAQAANEFDYHIPVGTNLDLPAGWQSFNLQVAAHCPVPGLVQQSPVMVVRKLATDEPLQVSIAGGQPQWNRSGGKDTLSFVLNANRAVAIQTLLIRDTETGNSVTAKISDPVDSTSHSIVAEVTPPLQLQGHHEYAYAVTFTSGGMSVTPAQPLPPIDLPVAPTQDYALVQFPTPDLLSIVDTSKDFTFQVQANDAGTVDAVFDVLQFSDGTSRLHGTASADGMTHTFTIHKNDIPTTDGQYSFHFEGTRSSTESDLVGEHPSVLTVATKAVLKDSIGLVLSSDGKSIVVSYCLSKATTNEVRISNTPNTFSVVGTGNAAAPGTVTCSAANPGYTATIPLNDFSAKVSAAKPAADPPAQLPIQLRIVDTSSGASTLASLNLAAVLVGGQTDDLVNSINKLTDKTATAADKTAATQTLTTKYQLGQSDINALTQAGKKVNIGTVLGSIGKNLVTAYLGIPAK